MRKISLILFMGGLFWCGCTSMGPDSGKLSEAEQLTVIDLARYTITRNRKNQQLVTAAERDIINKRLPEVKIRYTGPRQGRMAMSWMLDGKTINFIYGGHFLTDSASWEMGIVRHDYRISKNKVDPFRKRKNAVPSDFDDLRKKGKTTTGGGSPDKQKLLAAPGIQATNAAR
ncbi:MAG: hypothetical protein PHH77_05415 [Victivallaceae bacterium]|nr:hypothetical protein [Victivallaceae bacterium]